MDIIPARVLGLSADAKRGLEDLFFFANHFYGLQLEEQPHRLMTDVIMATEHDEDKPYSMLVVPRGCYKTSVARAAVVWKYLRRLYLDGNPHHRIVIASSTLALARSIMAGVGGIVQAGGFHGRIDSQYEPLWKNRDRKQSGSSRPDGIVFAPRIDAGELATIVEPNLFIASERRISTGFHADEALIDDLNNHENVKTDDRRAKTHTYWHLLFPILGTKDANGHPVKIMMLCTPWHDDDVRGMIQREEEEAKQADPEYSSPWAIIQHGSYNEDGSPFFPSKYPLEALTLLRQKMTTEHFSANFLCDPVGSNYFIHEDWIHWKSPKDVPADFRHIRICVDPNQHKEAKALGCYAAIIVAGYDQYWHTWILEALGSRKWNSQEFLTQLFELQERYPNATIYIEDSHMAHFQHAVTLEEGLRSEKAGYPVRLRINWVPVDVKTQKYERWEKMEPRFRNHAMYFLDTIRPDIKVEIKDELVRGKKARFQDFLDALAMTEQGYRPKPTDSNVAVFRGHIGRDSSARVIQSHIGGILSRLERKN